MKKLLMVSVLFVSVFGAWGHAEADEIGYTTVTARDVLAETKKKPCPFDWLGYTARGVSYPSGAIMVYGLLNWGADDGALFYYGLAGAGFGLSLALIADLANAPCRLQHKNASSTSNGGFGDIACKVVEHVQISVSPDGRQGYAGLRFGF